MASITVRARRSRASPLRYFWRRLIRPSTLYLDGLRLVVDRRIPTKMARGLYRETYEALERLAVISVLQKGDHVLEAGAGIGVVTLTAARIVGPDNITAYEPSEVSFGLLMENASNNNLKINARRKVLAPQSGKVAFYVKDNILGSGVYRAADAREIEVEADSIQSVLSETKANVLILDVEGAEVDLIDNCQLSSLDKLIIEIHPKVVGELAISKMIRRILENGFVLHTELLCDCVLTFVRPGKTKL